MFWIKIGIIIIGSIYAILIPHVVYKAAINVNLDLYEYTLSFLSNKKLFSKKTAQGYTRLLLITALLHYIFFWLLTQYYFLGEDEKLLSYIDYSAIFLTLLACVRHNMLPYSFKTLRATLLRLGHNILAVVVFLSLPLLILTFQLHIIENYKFIGIGGFIIAGLIIVLTLISVIKQGINGITELIFIFGISIWSIFVTVCTFFFY